VISGQYRGWYWLGTFEQRTIKHRDGAHEQDLVAKRYRILEKRDVNDRKALILPPVEAGDLRLWRADIDTAVDGSTLGSSQPLVGIDPELQMVGDGRMGLGVPDSLLVPTVSLITLLKLRSEAPFTYKDGSGAALALVTWRAEYDVSDYYLAWPQTSGCGMVIRPDLLAVLVAIAGEARLILRDFILGDSRLVGTDAKEPAG
jgi:hypothetical protein